MGFACTGEALSDLFAAVKDLGVPELVQENSQGVTDEFVDLDARLANQKRLEQRILEVLDQVSGKIGEVLEVERELSRVRETIERLEGRMRQLKDRVSMTTVKLFVREDEDYQPPQALSFGEEMGESWSGSITAMKSFFKELILFVIALSPWLLILFGLLLLIRRFFRKLSPSEEKLRPRRPPDLDRPRLHACLDSIVCYSASTTSIGEKAELVPFT